MRGILSTPACYRKVPIVATPPENYDPPKVSDFYKILKIASPRKLRPPPPTPFAKVASPQKVSSLSFFNYKHTESYAFNVFQLESIVKLLMYNINIFVHLQIYHEKALDNKEKMACLKLSFVVNVSSQIAQCKKRY